MIEPDIILDKVATIQRCLYRIKSVTDLNPEKLNDINAEDIFVLNLQRAVQATIDIANHVVAQESLGFPTSLRDNFTLLEDEGIIPSHLAEQMKNMCGFRNIATHNYKQISKPVLKAILTDHLKELELFSQTIMAYAGISGGQEP
jgi:uncharacterized protein YutE (UPF0331/DUF86 family)